MSIGRSPRAWRRRFSIALMSSLPAKGISTATSSNSHCADPGEGRTASAPSTIGAIERGVGGIADERRDEGHARRIHLVVNKAVLIAGPTASGKSALALRACAKEAGGVVINADSMQVYRDLRIITARPTLDEETARAAFRSMATSMPP